MKNYRIIMESLSNAPLEEVEVPELKPDQVLIRNFYTIVSAGTERAWSMDMPNAHSTFPCMPGYCGAGEVVKVGDRVMVNRAGHQLYSVKDEKLVANGKIKASMILSEIVSPQRGHEIYRMLAEEKNPSLGIAFDWTTLA